MLTKYKVIHPDGKVDEFEGNLAERPLFHQLQAVVQPFLESQRAGSNMEHVTVLSDEGYRTDMFVDEEGHSYGLPINDEATRIYHRASIARGEKHNLGIIPGAPTIAGVAIYFERRVWF